MDSKVVVALLALLAAIVSVTQAWGGEFHHYSPSRRSWDKCVGSGNKCYSTDQCCKGFVCAAFDDLFEGRGSIEGLNPEIPGYCVRERDLQPCLSSSVCEADSKCLSLGRAGTKYCVPRPEFHSSSKSNAATAKAKNGLGMYCEDSSECASMTKDGLDQLCCQEVRRYRQKAKQICDRITPISVCIPSKK